MDSMPIRRQTRPTTAVPNLKLHDAIFKFFDTWGDGPFEMEAIIHFISIEMAITPHDYIVVNNAIKQYILDNFKIAQGRMRSPQNVHVRYLMVSLK